MYEELLENDNSGEDKEVEEASLTEEELTEEALEEEAEEVQEEKAPEDTTEQIDALFDNDESEAAEENLEEEPAPQVKRNSAKPLLVLGLLVVLGAAGYFGYTKFNTPASLEDELQTPVAAEPEQPKEVVQSEAMPIETVDVQAPKAPSNEGNAVSIPAIEQNLDASILVSNLHVFWEVPSGYASNTSASRYLQKLGKIIQLNLKTELLLLNKPPITNKIGVEIKFNKSTRKFETVGITASSGEKSVDNLILQTVSRVLSMNLNINTDSLSKLQGNPVLIIRL